MDEHNWFGEDLMQEEWENSDEIGLKKIDLGEDGKLDFDTPSYVSVEIDKPDEKKISKIVMTWAIIFSLVTIPIFYHNIRNYINDYRTPSTRNPLKVKTTKLSYKNLYDKSGINITVKHYLTPSGNFINKKGIAPDISVSMRKSDYIRKNDRVLKQALKYIKYNLKISQK